MRIVAVVIVMLVLVAGANASQAKSVPRLVFPVIGAVTYSDDFGAPRSGGTHQGNDILADKKAPAVAVESGKVKFWTTSAAAGCMLYLYGDSGTTYLYIHLNNDLTMKNDNRGSCVAGTSYAPGLKDGARVGAGQLIGYVGDSGDANGIHPHLHFEVHPNDGSAVDPYPYLRKAQPLMFYAKTNAKVSLSLTGTIVSAFAGTLALKTSEIQVDAAKPVAVDRKVVLSLPDTTPVSLDMASLPLGLDALLSGLQAVAHTLPVRATLPVQRGDASLLTASRILLTS
jgi:murein DD-endopeptidase MepM/ murein hydrolase activator NlpD